MSRLPQHRSPRESIMRSFSPLGLLAALGLLSWAAGDAIAAVDTSQWKCESCPFEKAGSAATIELGIGAVSEASARFGNATGLQRDGAHLVAGGEMRYRNDNGWFARLGASNLGLDVRALAAEVGHEGIYSLRLAYAEIPRRYDDGARTPFSGGAVLSLPAGFPAPDTAAMPLATTLRAVEIGNKRSRLDAGLSWRLAPGWSTRLQLRHDERDGTQRSAGSFFSSASQFPAPVDHVVDQLELSTTYVSRRLQATLAYQGSSFRNGPDALVWANPFVPIVAGADRGQLALAPDNQFHQLKASAAYELTPWLRASGEIAAGRMSQDAAFVAATLNPNLLVAPLPAASFDGRVDTFNGSLRLTATPREGLRVHFSASRDVHDNRSASLAYPTVSTDIFVGALPRNNQPFSFRQDRFKLHADLRGPGSLKTSAGVEQQQIHRTLQEVVATRETTLWGRVAAQVGDQLSLALRLAHAERSRSAYGVVTWIDPPENPLLRKFNLADRIRDSGSLRADVAVGETVSLGFNLEASRDDYDDSPIGLTGARSVGAGVDVSAAISDQTRLTAYAQGEGLRWQQAGSQVFGAPDWAGRGRDRVSVLGIGIKHLAMKGRLELAADLTTARSRSDVTVDAGVASPPLPTATTTLESLKLRASYRIDEKMSLIGSLAHERYRSADWHVDGVLPATIPNLLALGEPAPRYRVDWLQVALRYRF